MPDTIFTEKAWAQYTDCLTIDKSMIPKINALIKNIHRNGYMKGIGKPEALKRVKAYSRRIDKENRLVYKDHPENGLLILSCKGHYE